MAVSPSPELEALLANVKKSYPDADTAPIELAFEGVTTHLDATAKKEPCTPPTYWRACDWTPRP